MKPILFNTEMVKAILAGRKTVTRKIAFPNDNLREFDSTNYPNGWWFRGRAYKSWQDVQYDILPLCKYKVGNALYVRETWCKGSLNWGAEQYFYRADENEFYCSWKPSSLMPKEAARIFLRVTDVRVEQLQDIRLEGCLAEGVQLTFLEERDLAKRGLIAWQRYSTVWDSTIKKSDIDKYGWDANPWVWVIGFERISKEKALKNV